MNRFLLTFLPLLFGSLQLFELPSLAERRSDKYPCIEDVCIGDKLKDLSNINWLPARFNILGRQKPLKAVGNPANIKAFAPYMYAFVIDSKGAKILSGIKGFCQVNQGVNGIYLDKRGRKVRVGFLPKVSDDGRSQSFIVSSIIQDIVPLEAANKSQAQDLRSQIQQKYSAYDGSNRDESLVGMAFSPESVYVLSLSGPTQGPKAMRIMQEDDFRNFPGCPRSSRIKL
jgi:hypothetical protein